MKSAAAGVSLMLASMSPAQALTLTCILDGDPVEIRYKGEAKGTLSLAAPFGSADLPASRHEATNADGDAVTGIRAFGRAQLRLPDRQALAACVGASKAGAELAKMACIDETGLADEAETVVAMVSVALLEGDAPRVEINRYKEAADGGVELSVDSFPRGCQSQE